VLLFLLFDFPLLLLDGCLVASFDVKLAPTQLLFAMTNIVRSVGGERVDPPSFVK
jgi:hypothetical protein